MLFKRNPANRLGKERSQTARGRRISIHCSPKYMNTDPTSMKLMVKENRMMGHEQRGRTTEYIILRPPMGKQPQLERL